MACVALGANLGNAVTTVRHALSALGGLPHTRLVKASSLYRSAPYEAQGPDFINAVVCVETQLTALALLHALQALELRYGRERPYQNAPRTLDLDLIFYGDAVLQTPELTLPHPRWYARAFVVLPMAEICPERVSAAQLVGVKDQVIQRLHGEDLL